MSSIIRRSLSYLNKIFPKDIVDPIHAKAVERAGLAKEEKYPEVKKALIKGTKPHQSHKDPSDPKKVISVRYFDKDNKRLGTDHIHADGTVIEDYKGKK